MSAAAAETMAGVAADVDWQRLWFTLQERAWTSLAVVGTDSGNDADRVARLLAMVGQRDGHVPVQMVSALGIGYTDVPRIVAQLALASPETHLLVVSCDPLRRSPAMIPIVHAASGVVLVSRLGESLLESVRTTVEAVGRDRVLATVTVG